MRASSRRVAKPASVASPNRATSRVVSGKPAPNDKGCAESLEERVLEEVVAATYWFDPGTGGEPYTALVRFAGRRVGPSGKPQPKDRFDQVEVVKNVVPGTGPVSVTTRVNGINPGEWIVTAEPIVRQGQGRFVKTYAGPAQNGAGSLTKAPWSWRKPANPIGSPTALKTRPAPFAKRPGTWPGAWWGFVGPGVLVGLALQSVLLTRVHVDVRVALLVSLAASLAGFAGAKAWFLALNRSFGGLFTEGLCIQGFVAGALVTAAIALPLAHLPIGTFLDATAPGLFLGMALGRPGCFFTGCCAGRPTTSRWGIWSSDRNVGARRIPTQLLESLLCLAVGAAALVLVLYTSAAMAPGAVLIGAVAAYVLGRQFLLPFRAEPRKSSIGPRLSMAAAGVVLASAILALAGACIPLGVHSMLLLC